MYEDNLSAFTLPISSSFAYFLDSRSSESSTSIPLYGAWKRSLFSCAFALSLNCSHLSQTLLSEASMAGMSPKDSPLSSSPLSSPNIGALLKIKIISWSQETGFPVSVFVRVGSRTFNLHKHPLVSKSGYFKKRLEESTEVELPPEFPGGSETFGMIALFFYGSFTLLDPFNVASIRCAAEFLQMTENYTSGNLSDHSDLYLNQIVLQSWDDTLIVLQNCQPLLPWSEELLIVSRCIDSLAFMACMEALDPERRRDQPVTTVAALATHGWSCEIAKNVVGQDPWIKDLIALPFGYFKRIIISMRRQGMREKYVSPIIIFYANKWVLSKKTRQFLENSGEKMSDNQPDIRVSVILRGILDLLMLGGRSSRLIPVGFYFALLSNSLEISMDSEVVVKLQDQIASMLDSAKVEDFLLPKTGVDSVSSSRELVVMERIFITYVSSNMKMNHSPPRRNSIVAELWDEYLIYVGSDPTMPSSKFVDLIEKVPLPYRENHDQLYGAVDSFLQAHSNLSQEEKSEVCKYLSCQKLSPEVCTKAVQNELMPLRLIVQALFVQQLNTQRAFKECSDYEDSLSANFSSSNSKTQHLWESPFTDEGSDNGGRSLRFLLRNEMEMKRNELSRKEYECTSFRIQNLEEELNSLKKRMIEWQKKSKKTESPNLSRSISRKTNPLGKMSSCTGFINFTSQRKNASRLFKVFRRIIPFGTRENRRENQVSQFEFPGHCHS